MDSHRRSLAKAISYRLLASAGTALIFLALTGQLALSLGAGALDVVLKLALYFAHERLWARIPWGKSAASYTVAAHARTHERGIALSSGRRAEL